MSRASAPTRNDSKLRQQEGKGLLRVITCGSVGDGKSTLIGRLLNEAADPALAIDGPAAEPERGVPIDVAGRSFSTGHRSFFVTEMPGHEQCAREVVADASAADLAVIVVDARKGVLAPTRRHSTIVSRLGVRQIVLAVNKMDLVDYGCERFDEIVAEYRKFAARNGLVDVAAIPLSALNGDNVVCRGTAMPWYQGPTLLQTLETVELERSRLVSAPLRLPVQSGQRPDSDLRGVTGTIASGQLRPGNRVRVLPSGRESTVARIAAPGGESALAVVGQSVTLTLADETDISRGDLICAAAAPAEVADQFETTLVWMHDDPLLVGRPYLLKIGAATVPMQVTDLKYRLDTDTLAHLAAKTLALNEIGVANISIERPIAFEPYATNRELGRFIVIDKLHDVTVGVGMIHFALRRAHNIHVQAVDVSKAVRARVKGQQPCVLWFTGLSGAGKSTVANLVEKKLAALGRHTYLLDGDNVRHGLNRDLGFTAGDRVENIRRIAEVSRLMVDAGLIVLTAFISPFRAERRLARGLVAEGEFIEVFVDAPLEVAESRDAKGLYAKARRGELKNFTGIDSPYERPEAAELRLDTAALDPETAAERVIELLRQCGVI